LHEEWIAMSEDQRPKIQIDDDWKAEALKEKQRLAEQFASSKSSSGQETGGAANANAAATTDATQAQADRSTAGGRQADAAGDAALGKQRLPEASFESLVNMFATQAMLYMGLIPEPRSGQRYMQLGLAKHHIDLLTILEEKTKGNLTQEEADSLAVTLFELRNQYVQIATASRSTAQH